MFNIAYHLENENHKCDTTSYSLAWLLYKTCVGMDMNLSTCIGKDMKWLELMCTVGGNGEWMNCFCEKQDSSSSKN